MRISDWSSDVCSSDLPGGSNPGHALMGPCPECIVHRIYRSYRCLGDIFRGRWHSPIAQDHRPHGRGSSCAIYERLSASHGFSGSGRKCPRSEEHTSELQELIRISYASFFLTKKK